MSDMCKLAENFDRIKAAFEYGSPKKSIFQALLSKETLERAQNIKLYLKPIIDINLQLVDPTQVTISKVVPSWLKIKEFLESFDLKNDKKLEPYLSDAWLQLVLKKIANFSDLELATCYLDPKFKHLLDNNTQIPKAIAKIRQTFTKLQKFDSNLQNFSENELNLFQNEPKSEETVLNWWKSKESQYPCLGIVARSLLSVPAIIADDETPEWHDNLNPIKKDDEEDEESNWDDGSWSDNHTPEDPNFNYDKSKFCERDSFVRFNEEMSSK